MKKLIYTGKKFVSGRIYTHAHLRIIFWGIRTGGGGGPSRRGFQDMEKELNRSKSMQAKLVKIFIQQ